MDCCSPCKKPGAIPLPLACGHICCVDCLRTVFAIRTQPLMCRYCAPFHQGRLSLAPAWFTPPKSPYNQYYIQHGAFGLASYWIDADLELSYIYYSASVPWLLDNGNRPPSRKYFDNCTYDGATRTFRGEIDWNKQDNTTFGGDSQWKYEMVFSPDFTRIVAGEVRKRPSLRVNRFGDQLVYAILPHTNAQERLYSVLCLQALCSAHVVYRLGKRSLARRLFPRELLRLLRGFLECR